MGNVAWSPLLESGVPGIDQQHEEMFHRVNAFLDACKGGRGRESLLDSLEFLEQYCKEHFAMEERLMRTHGYPELQEHVRLHDGLLELTRDIRAHVTQLTPDEAEVGRFGEALFGWLANHIAGEDMKVFRFLRDKHT